MDFSFESDDTTTKIGITGAPDAASIIGILQILFVDDQSQIDALAATVEGFTDLLSESTTALQGAISKEQ